MNQAATKFPTTVHEESSDFASLLGQLAGAHGCALYEARHGQRNLVRSAATGDRPPDLEELGYEDIERIQRRKQWASLPLYHDGLLSAVLIFAFESEAHKRAAEGSLRKIAPLFASLGRFVNARHRQVNLATRISELESEIASQKILERARGILSEHPNLNEATIELVDRHVAKVLGACQFGQLLEDQLRELEGRAAERDMIARAKAILQEREGMSEQDAYQYLRTISRQKRQKISVIAAAVIGPSKA